MQKPRLSIVEALNSNQFFRPAFGDLSTWWTWQIFMKSMYGLELDDDEQRVFSSCTGRKKSNPQGFREAYAIVGRRGGKSRIASLIASYEALLGGWETKLSKGERGWIFIIANDRAQANIIYLYIKSLLEQFEDMLKQVSSEEIHLTNGVSITVKPCSFRASRGYSTIAILADELAFWRDTETSANPAREIINSLLPGLLPNGLMIGISTPYAKQGYLWEIFKENRKDNDSDILVWQAPTRIMNPAYDEQKIQRLLKRDRAVFSAEYEATFREDIQAFLPEELIKASMDHSALPYDSAYRYVCFVDPSGGRSDSFTMAIAHRAVDKIILDRIEERRSPFDPVQVVKEFSCLLQSYKVSEIEGDRYAGVWPENAFLKHDIVWKMSQLSASELYLEFACLLMSANKVRLIDSERLLGQLTSLERRTHSGGKDSVDHPPGLHDDLANSACGACVMAAREEYLTSDEKLRQYGPHLPGDKPNVDRRSCQEIFDAEMRASGAGCFVKKKNPWE